MVTFQAHAVPVRFKDESAEALTMHLKYLTQASQILLARGIYSFNNLSCYLNNECFS